MTPRPGKASLSPQRCTSPCFLEGVGTPWGRGRPPPYGRKEKGGRAVPGGGGRALWELLKVQRSFAMAFGLWRRVHAGVYIRGIYHRRRTLCRGWSGFYRKHCPYGPVCGGSRRGGKGPGSSWCGRLLRRYVCVPTSSFRVRTTLLTRKRSESSAKQTLASANLRAGVHNDGHFT